MAERKAVRLQFRLSATVLHGVRLLAHPELSQADTMRALLELAVYEATVARSLLDDDRAPLAPPTKPLVLPFEAEVAEDTWRWLEYRAYLSALTLEQACASVLEELANREMSPGIGTQEFP